MYKRTKIEYAFILTRPRFEFLAIIPHQPVVIALYSSHIVSTQYFENVAYMLILTRFGRDYI